MNSYPKYGKPFEPGKFYHIYNRAVGNERLFESRENFLFFLKKYQKYTIDHISTYSYCLLENHFHFLIKFHESSNDGIISEQLRRFLISYAKAFNKQQNRKGSLFEKHLKRVKIESNEQLMWTIYYIHRNPAHHQLTLSYNKYGWSSFPALLSEKSTDLKRAAVFELFDGKENFIKFHEKNMELDILSKKIRFSEF